ncbi:hypothetical protein CO038_03580 [Candidatus Pacearchaeota archaeon CG_4_9_14_0_2_um_filter_39_13]|nr:hypothetical protein [Candidatus Pacearchaeota archaeon]OIO44339.1 MAG: hypothetical protein AUJ64_00280 [Candidatus Pacearchaeota archaeon CG1_02_39_14]PJC44449.1 MAG: hypothetical protein CO038_03580 [Candidatus Pacearchaeota archaeon CG_4_9_14_0_2_um_filter_39_13]
MNSEEYQKYLAKAVFDSTRLAIIPCSDIKRANKEGPELNKKMFEVHIKRFDQVVVELERDFKETGMELTFSSRTIINQAAMSMITMEKVLLQMQVIPFVYVIHKDDVLIKTAPFEHTHHPLNREHNVHPYFEKLYFRLQNQINSRLKKLGLLPIQQIEKQKLTIIKKLKQKFEDIDKEYRIKAEKEVLSPKKKETEKQEEKVVVETDK